MDAESAGFCRTWFAFDFTALLLNIMIILFTKLAVDDSISFNMPVRPVRPAMPVLCKSNE